MLDNMRELSLPIVIYIHIHKQLAVFEVVKVFISFV